MRSLMQIGRISSFAGFVSATAMACTSSLSDEQGGDAAELTTASQALNVASTTIWPTPAIAACWETTNYPTERRWAEEAIRDSWETASGITVIGWNTCSPSSGGIRVNMRDTPAGVPSLGRTLDGVVEGVALNAWASGVCDSTFTQEDCVRATAVHEVGHALGFAHEQNRSDVGGSCLPCSSDTDCGANSYCGNGHCRQGDNGDVAVGAYDVHSVMNYCNPVRDNKGILSTTDVIGARQFYGASRYHAFQGLANNEVYVLLADDSLWHDTTNMQNAYQVDTSVRDFQGVGSNHEVYVLGRDGNLWLEYTDWHSRYLVDSSVRDFQALSVTQVIFVLGRDGNLWREKTTSARRSQVDGNVREFQAMNGTQVYVLGTDGNLWREQTDWHNRTLVDSTVRSFQALDSTIVYVLDMTGNLWREYTNSQHRDLVDWNVREFYAASISIVYVLGNDGNLWREQGNYQTRTQVDGSVLRFQYVNDSLIYVEGTDQKLWRELGSWQDRSLVDQGLHL